MDKLLNFNANHIPMRSTFLTAEWRKLAIANYAVAPGLLAPYLPYKTELDIWNGTCYVSLVGFRFINTKLKGVSVPFHTAFEEINLRFYVRYKEGDVWKRGVSFVKEIVPKPALTLVANTIYKERYVTLPTRHQWTADNALLDVTYEWKHRGAWDSLRVSAAAQAAEMAPGSEEEFITEHYWGYTQLGARRTSEYGVEHPRWQTYPVEDYSIEVRFGELYGAAFGFLQDCRPDSVMLAEGSRIAVRSAARIG